MELSKLQQEFLDDHRRLTKGLTAIVSCLEEGDQAEATKLAAELDHDAGAHMAFEEEVFYPRLARVYGQEFVDRMVAEHEIGQVAVKRLLEQPPGEALAGDERDEVLAQLQVALGHVMSCGSMLSELDSGGDAADDEALERLRELRDRHERWSDRSY